MNSNIKELKSRLRLEYKEKRKNIPPEIKAKMDAQICRRFLSLTSYRYADTVLLYSPLKYEIDTSLIAADALSKGKKIAYPRCVDGEKMLYHYATSPDDLKSGSFGIREPDENLPEFETEKAGACIYVIPAIVYDKKGYRIGYGKGYYDRFLPGFKGIKAGLAYSDFVIDEIPRGKFDIRADIVVTEKGVITFAKN